MFILRAMRNLQNQVGHFNEERGWGAYHNRRSLVLAMCEELGELAKLVAWEDGKERDPEDLALELADLLIYALSFANCIGIDAEMAVLKKLSLNSRRFPT